jgi:hypothetical protein
MNFVLLLGKDDAVDDGFNDQEVYMEENDVMFVDFFDVVRHPLTSLVQSLRFIYNSGLFIVALIVLIVKFLNILFR